MKKKSIATGFSKHFLGLLVLFLCSSFFISSFVEAQGARVLLRDVQALTLRRGEYTKGRRSSPVPQLSCVGGTAYGRYAPKVVQCVSRGFDGLDVQWECKADMSNDYQFGKIEVSCEGYDYPNDPYILAGSCGLNYELDFSSSGARKDGTYTKPSAPYEEQGIGFIHVVYFLVACFVIYLIYTSLCGPREGNEGNRRTGGGSDGGYPPQPPGWRPPPPPPSYDESCNKGRSSNTGTASGNNGSSGPGFFTGMGLGALGGYLFGNRNTGYGGYGNSNFRRRNNYGYNQFERDTGFYNNDNDRPSTSTGYFGGRTESGGSSGTHTSTGFGGTTRR